MRASGEHERGVVVVGSINVDLVVRVDRLPTPGETVSGGVFERHAGGKGANQAVAAARLGAPVRFLGAVGEDEMGEESVRALAREGVDVSAVAQIADVATGVAVIVVDAAGENQIAVASGANAAVDGNLVERGNMAADASTRVCLLSFEVPDAALVAAGRAARDAGMLVVVSPAPARPLAEALLELAPILVPNHGEVALLAGVPEPADAAQRLSERTGAPVVVTLGADGALVVEGHEQRRFAAHRVEAVDTTGAGDAFAGALVAELALGRDLRDAVPYALAAASLSVTVSGAREGMPTRDAVDAFLAGRPTPQLQPTTR